MSPKYHFYAIETEQGFAGANGSNRGLKRAGYRPQPPSAGRAIDRVHNGSRSAASPQCATGDMVCSSIRAHRQRIFSLELGSAAQEVAPFGIYGRKRISRGILKSRGRMRRDRRAREIAMVLALLTSCFVRLIQCDPAGRPSVRRPAVRRSLPRQHERAWSGSARNRLVRNCSSSLRAGRNGSFRSSSSARHRNA